MRERITGGLCLTSDWLTKWREISYNTKTATNYFWHSRENSFRKVIDNFTLVFSLDCKMLGHVLVTGLNLINVTVKMKITSYQEDLISPKLE